MRFDSHDDMFDSNFVSSLDQPRAGTVIRARDVEKRRLRRGFQVFDPTIRSLQDEVDRQYVRSGYMTTY